MPLSSPWHSSGMPPGCASASGCSERSRIMLVRCAGRPPKLISNSHLPWGPQVSSARQPQWFGGLLGLLVCKQLQSGLLPFGRKAPAQQRHKQNRIS